MKRKQNRQKKPKSLRFSRYFLRTLIPCLLVASVFAAYAFNSFSESTYGLPSFDEFYYIKNFYLNESDNSNQDWSNWSKKYSLSLCRTDLTDAEFAEQYGVDRMTLILSRMVSNEMYPDLQFRTECNAMLLDPDTGEFILAQPLLSITAKGGNEYSRIYRDDIILSDPNETETYIKSYQKYLRSKKYPLYLYKSYVPDLLEKLLPFGDIGEGLGWAFEKKMNEKLELYPYYRAYSVYVNGHQARGLSYRISNSKIVSTDQVLTDSWKLLICENEMSEEEKWQFCDSSLDQQETPERLDGQIEIYGQPADSVTSIALREIIAESQNFITLSLAEKDMYEGYLESAKQSGGLYRFSNGDELTVEDLNSHLELVRSSINEQPLRYFVILQKQHRENSRLTKKEWKSLQADSFMVRANGKDYLLFFIATKRNYWHQYRPIIILNCIILLTGVLLLSLILALIPYLRSKRRYARDEYRRGLTAALAHDLKSPLTAISGYAENLASGVHPEKQAHYAEAIQDTARYMDGLITNVLDLAKLEQDEKTKIIAVDLIALAEEHLAHRKEAFDERSLQVTVKGRCKVRADRRMLSQAVQNLLDNAFKFTPDGGSITVTGGGRTLCIENEIAEERIPDADRLCEAFVKGDTARSNQSGSGLGLSVVRQAARLNRMKFTVESREHRFITALTGGRRAQRQAENEIRNDLREANAVTPTDIIALMREQVNAVTEQETGEASRGVTWKFTGSCRLYARPQDMKAVLAKLTEHALGCVPDGAEIAVTGEKNALHIVHPADRKRLSREESEIVTAAVRKLVKKSKLCFDAEEQNGLFKITVREKSLLFRPIHFRK